MASAGTGVGQFGRTMNSGKYWRNVVQASEELYVEWNRYTVGSRTGLKRLWHEIRTRPIYRSMIVPETSSTSPPGPLGCKCTLQMVGLQANENVDPKLRRCKGFNAPDDQRFLICFVYFGNSYILSIAWLKHHKESLDWSLFPSCRSKALELVPCAAGRFKEDAEIIEINGQGRIRGGFLCFHHGPEQRAKKMQ